MTPTRPDGDAFQTYTILFKALSDETRLRIYLLLGTGELCVCQIQEALAMSQAKVSRHLTVLRHAGLVAARREGLWMYYSRAFTPDSALHAFAFRLARLLEDESALNDPIVADRRNASLPRSETARPAGDDQD